MRRQSMLRRSLRIFFIFLLLAFFSFFVNFYWFKSLPVPFTSSPATRFSRSTCVVLPSRRSSLLSLSNVLSCVTAIAAFPCNALIYGVSDSNSPSMPFSSSFYSIRSRLIYILICNGRFFSPTVSGDLTSEESLDSPFCGPILKEAAFFAVRVTEAECGSFDFFVETSSGVPLPKPYDARLPVLSYGIGNRISSSSDLAGEIGLFCCFEWSCITRYV